jgi:hypothetical protein
MAAAAAATLTGKKRYLILPHLEHSFLGKVLHLDAASWAYIHASPAPDTVLVSSLEGTGCSSIRAPALKSDRGLSDQVPANIHAQPAQGAFLILGFFQVGVMDAKPCGEFANDGRAPTPGKQHLNHHSPIPLDSLGVGEDLQPIVLKRIIAGRHDPGSLPPPDFHNAHPAHAVRLQRGMIAEGWDVNSHFSRTLKDGGSRSYRCGLAINGDLQHLGGDVHCLFLYHVRVTASYLQTS